MEPSLSSPYLSSKGATGTFKWRTLINDAIITAYNCDYTSMQYEIKKQKTLQLFASSHCKQIYRIDSDFHYQNQKAGRKASGVHSSGALCLHTAHSKLTSLVAFSDGVHNSLIDSSRHNDSHRGSSISLFTYRWKSGERVIQVILARVNCGAI